MDRTERFYRIDQLLHERSCVPTSAFLKELEVSPATFKRDLDYMKDRLYAPIEWDRDLGGYRFVEPDSHAPSYALPGLWFNATEIHALLTMQHLLSNLQPGLLGSHIEPLQARLRAMLGGTDHSADEVEKRFRMVYASRRKVLPEHFQVIASGLLRRQRVTITHFNRQSNETLERDISPQRLVYYRENWYLAAWCHLRDGLRSFSLDAIRGATPTNVAAREVPKKLLSDTLESGYGIFAGPKPEWATLRFSPERARWVAAEEWHPKQRGHFDQEGRYLLELPYSDDREIVMDILKHGAHAEVVAPLKLRERIQEELRKTLSHYHGIRTSP